LIAVREEGVNHTDGADATRPSLNVPLGSENRCVRAKIVAFCSESPGRLPVSDYRSPFHSRAKVRRHDTALLLSDFRGPKPRRDTTTGGNGLPDLFRSSGHLDFDLDEPAAGFVDFDAHVFSS